ncbi:stress response protein nst1-like [Lytechinus variegatus]|uniref:stress response protein nst1-like n=1 Tax=Lytechinus variegatus TaxID=7654 RepID=UPI001BB188AA|nr:stress response protein nst1-like [Lytechinus variegatus]
MSHWTEDETAVLIDIWREDSIFNEVACKNTRSKKVYERLAQRLSSVGIQKTEKQIKYKIKNLKSEFKKTRDILRTSGEAAVPKGKYYDLIAEILGGTPSVDPQRGSVLESSKLDDTVDSAIGLEPEVIPDVGDPEPEVEELDIEEFINDSPQHLDDMDDEEPHDPVEDAEQGQPPAARLVLSSEENEDEGDDLPERGCRKRKDGNGTGRRATCKRRREDSSVKDKLERIIKDQKERDDHYRQELKATRRADSDQAKEELETMRQMIELTRMQMQQQREEAERRERRERELREQEDKKWTMFFSSFMRQPGPAMSASQPPYPQQHTSYPFVDPPPHTPAPATYRPTPPHTPAPATYRPTPRTPAPATYRPTPRTPAPATYTPTSHLHNQQSSRPLHSQPSSHTGGTQNDAEKDQMEKTYHML